MEELYQGIQTKNTLVQNIKQIVLIIIIASWCAYGVASIWFGNSSIEVYTNLNTRINYLQKEIDGLNKVNAKLQKDYFELLNIQGDYAY